jgi:hypothetical protein
MYRNPHMPPELTINTSPLVYDSDGFSLSPSPVTPDETEDDSTYPLRHKDYYFEDGSVTFLVSPPLSVVVVQSEIDTCVLRLAAAICSRYIAIS